MAARTTPFLLSFMAACFGGLLQPPSSPPTPGNFVHTSSQTSPKRTPIYHLPFRYDPLLTPMPVLPAIINGKPFAFIVDTGANMDLLIDSRVAKALKLPLRHETIRVKPGNQMFTKAKIHSFSLIGMEEKSATAIQLNVIHFHGLPKTYVGHLTFLSNFIYSSLPIAGIIGAPILASYSYVCFDFSKKFITISNVPLPSTDKLGSIEVPMQEYRNRYRVPIVTNTNSPLSLLIDTGSTFTCFDPCMPALYKSLAKVKSSFLTLAGKQQTYFFFFLI